MDIKFLEGASLVLAGTAAGFYFLRWKDRKFQAATRLMETSILDQARRDGENIVREARLKASEEALNIRQETERSFADRREALFRSEQAIAQRENIAANQLASVAVKETAIHEKEQTVAAESRRLANEQTENQRLRESLRELLQRAGKMTEAEARAQFLREVETSARKDAHDLSRHIMDEARHRAEEMARKILSLAIQRYAGQHTFETTTATVAITGDEIKGRIIGREGRNIRAFEAATGITVLIDDTPNAVVLSGFDPIRREIARESMQRLIQDGRIHPARIEEVAEKVKAEMNENVLKWGEEAIFELGLPPMHLEILKKLGALKFRYSFSQNILNHSIEVARLMALMASELGLDVVDAKKSGLLHDIGKALDHEIEGSHAIIGADFIKRHGEPENIVNAVASHHDEVPHTNPLGILVSAADAISASRPGARSETMATYIHRLESLEKIGLSFTGVEKAFAIQAGRELRVMVQPSQISDAEATELARKITRKIEDELQYPGQIRVTVVRETRCVEWAK